METNTKIYIANLGKYNEGYLVGKWISLPCTDKELEDLFVQIGVAEYDENGSYISSHWEGCVCYEEVAIHDYETDIPSFKIWQYANIRELNEQILEIEKLYDDEYIAFCYYIDEYSNDIDEALKFANRHDYAILSGSTKEDVCMDYVYEMGLMENIPESLVDYIDWDRYADDCLNVARSKVDNECWIEVFE